jgi:Mg2+ and Co2+ transporter CorA
MLLICIQYFDDAQISEQKQLKKLAESSQKDSSSMKTIAILGMVFLPGTFVAVS